MSAARRVRAAAPAYRGDTMTRLLPRSVVRFLKKDEGVTAVECALMLALVVVICLVALTPTSPPAGRRGSNRPYPSKWNRADVAW